MRKAERNSWFSRPGRGGIGKRTRLQELHGQKVISSPEAFEPAHFLLPTTAAMRETSRADRLSVFIVPVTRPGLPHELKITELYRAKLVARSVENLCLFLEPGGQDLNFTDWGRHRQSFDVYSGDTFVTDL